MKSSKYTQATDFQDNLCQNVGTVLPPEPENNQNARSYTPRQNGNSEELLLNSVYDLYNQEQSLATDARYNAEQNSNIKANQEVELLCNCALKDVVFSPRASRLPHFYNSEQNIVRANCNFSPTSNIVEYRNSSQYSLDRKSLQHKANHPKQKHTYSCQQNSRILQRLRRNSSLKRGGQCPEVTNVHCHNQPVFEAYGPDNCVIKSYDYNPEKDFKCDDFGFKRGRSIRSRNERSRRRAPDGTDSEMDEPELMFELTEHLGDCRCACDHLAYSPAYTNCTQEERFPPAPDVTRRLGGVTPLGVKPEGPPYYRTASATTNSSSSGSASSRIDLSSRHWWIIVTVLLLAAAAGVGVPLALRISAGASLEERLEFASRLLQEVPLIDGHNDLPWNIRMFLHNRLKDFKFGEDLRNVSPWSTSAWSHTDLPRLKQGHVAAQFFAAYVPCEAQHKDAVQLTLEQIDVIRRLTDQYHPSLTLCSSAEDIKVAYSKHQLCSLIGVEGGHSLAGSLAVLRTLYHVGVRYLTLTSTCNTPWADCSYADMPGHKPEHSGLTNFGKTVIKEMNRLGMIVDLSHVSVHTMRDALAVSKAPVIFSHSSAHALCNSTRNVPDETLQKLALNKGIIMVNFYSLFLSCKEVSTIQDAVAHINHIRDVAGVDNVGLGAGYDGINFTPKGLEDVSSYPTLFAELIATGRWSTDDLKKLAGLNFLRVLQDVERVRDEFKKAKIPPYEDVLMPKPPSNCSSS